MSDPILDCPYVGLVPFTEREARFFFGRARSTRVIISNLFASRLTILYGASGVGKTSALRAGVVHELQRRITERDPDERPDLAVAYYNDWSGNPARGLDACLRRAIRDVMPDAGPIAEGGGLVQTARSCAEQIDGNLLVLLDQFEEFFLYQSNWGPDSFADQLARTINESGPGISFLLSLRDDAVSKLDGFKSRIPNLFSNYLRLDHLSTEEAQEAIRGPVEQYVALPDAEKTHAGAFQVEDALVGAVVAGVRAGRVLLGTSGEGGVGGESGGGVETPYLQLVMTQLWHREVSEGSLVLRKSTLDALGGPTAIVRGHLEQAMARLSPQEREIAARIFRYLVTPSGSKFAHAVSDLAAFAQLEEAELQPVLDRLSATDMRVLRPVSSTGDPDDPGRYEIFHDALGPAVGDWWKQQEAARAREVEIEALKQRSRQRARVALAILSFGLVIASLSVAFVFNQQRSEAEQARRIAELEILRTEQAELRLQREMAQTQAEKAKAEERLKTLLRPIAAAEQEIPPRVYIHIRDRQQQRLAQTVTEQLEAADIVVPGVERLVDKGPRRNELRYFRQAERAEAERIVEIIKGMGISVALTDLSRSYEKSTAIRARHFELWFASLIGSVWHIDRSPVIGDLIFELEPEGKLKNRAQPGRGSLTFSYADRFWRTTESQLLIEKRGGGAPPSNVWAIDLIPRADGLYALAAESDGIKVGSARRGEDDS